MYRYIEILKKILSHFPEDLIQKYKEANVDKRDEYDSFDRDDFEELIFLKREILETAVYDLEPYDGEYNHKEVEKYYRKIEKTLYEFRNEIDDAKEYVILGH
jgi:hypothetical protein